MALLLEEALDKLDNYFIYNFTPFTMLCEANKNKEKEDQNVLGKKNKCLRYSIKEDN